MNTYEIICNFHSLIIYNYMFVKPLSFINFASFMYLSLLIRSLNRHYGLMSALTSMTPQTFESSLNCTKTTIFRSYLSILNKLLSVLGMQ